MIIVTYLFYRIYIRFVKMSHLYTIRHKSDNSFLDINLILYGAHSIGGSHATSHYYI